MKKKTKIILNLASITAIGSIVLGTSLGCALYHDNKQNTTSSQAKNDSSATAKQANLAVSDGSSASNYNDNAYLQTINQPGTINPFSTAWTKTTALSYTMQGINDMVASFGTSYILRWVLIQNFNYNITQYLQVVNASIFDIAVQNFNYSITNVTNNNNLQNFSCTVNFNIKFKATCKEDNSSITFSNNYVYNNVKLQPMVMSIGNAGYSYLQLVNNNNDTFAPSQVNYCENASISSNWSNKDFEYLLGLNWLPIASSYPLTTNNYQTALPACCTRSFNHHTNQADAQQATFINFVSQYQLYTFNIGYKFNDLSSLVIECNNQYNANNKYEVSLNQAVTLSINTVLGTINPTIDPSIKIEWQEQVTKDNKTSWVDVAQGDTYSFSALNSNVYRAVATFINGKQTISNSVSINVENSTLLIASKANSYDYGTSCLLYITDNLWSNLQGITYQWKIYDGTTGNWVNASGVSNSTTYSFNVYASGTYELVISNNAGFSLTSNSLSISVYNNSVTISASNSSVDYANNVTLKVDTTKWANNPDLIYTWTIMTGTSSTTYSETGKSTYSFDVSNDVLCKLVITSKVNKNFELTSNIVPVNVSNNSIIIGVSGLSPNQTNQYDLDYGKTAAITIDNSYWNTPSLSNTWTYEWEGFGPTKNGKDEWQVISNPNNANTLNINSIAGVYSMYQLVLINKTNGLKLTSTNVVSINLLNQNAVIDANWSNQTSNGASSIAVEQGSSVTFKVANYWAQSQFTNSSSYEYEWYDNATNSIVGHGSSFTVNQITKNSSYYLVILNTTNKNFMVKSNMINVNINATYPLIQSTTNSSNVGYGQQITLKLETGTNNFWYSTGITYQWCTVSNGIITPIEDGASNYYQAVTNPTYTPFITQKSVEYCLQATVGGKKYYSNIIYAGYAHDSDNVTITLNGVANPNQTLTYYPSTYTAASNHILSIANGDYWLNPTVSSNVKVTYQWYSYQKNAITGAQENLTKLSAINNTAYEASFGQVNNGTTYYELEITQEVEITTSSGTKTITIGNPITSTIAVTSTTNPIQCQIDATYGNVTNIASTVYQCYYGSWIELELAATQNPNQQVVYNNCSYQWQVFNGENWIDVPSGTNIDGNTSGTISGSNFAQFAFWISTYTQYRLHIYLNNPNYDASNPYSNQYSYSIFSSPITFKVTQDIININAVNLTANATSSVSSENPNQYQFSYGSQIKLSIDNNWISAYSGYVQYIWQTYDSNAEQWVNYDATTQSFPISSDVSNQTGQGNNSCTFYFTQDGQYRLIVQYWKDNQENSSTSHPYLAYSLSSNIVNLQVDHGNVYINSTANQNKNNSNEYQIPYGSAINFGIENSSTNYYVENRTQYVFNWTWTMGSEKYQQSYSPSTNTSQYAPSSINIYGYTTVSLTITLNKNDTYYYQAFSLGADNDVYITCQDSSISVQYTIGSQTGTSGTCNYADSLSLNIDSTDYWYGKTGYTYYWCVVQADGTWIVLNHGTSSTSGANYNFYATQFNGSDVITYQLLMVQDPSQAFTESSITINGKAYEHITHINNVFALRSNLLTITVNNANCNITCNGTNTSGKQLSQDINFGSSFTLSFANNYWSNYDKNQVASNIAYQWQENSGSGWTNINGANQDTYKTSATSNGVQYRLALSWNWSTDSSATFTVYSYVATINLQNASVSINATDLTTNQAISNGASIPFGSQLKLSIAQAYWQDASTVKSYAWTISSNSDSGSTNTFEVYVLGQEGEVVTYTLTITLTDGSSLSATYSIKITDATCSITPTTSSGNSLVLNNNTYTINYGSLCKINVSGYWANFLTQTGYTFTLTYNGNDLASDEFLAQTGTYQVTITNANWGKMSVSSNLINITTTENTFSLTAVANNSGSNITLNSDSYVANYGTSVNLQIANGFDPGSVSASYSVTKTYQWYFIYSYEDSTTNTVVYDSTAISSATNDNLNIYLLSASSYNLIETYTVKNSSGNIIGSLSVNAASHLNLNPTNIGICSIQCTNYQVNSQGVYSVPYLSSPKLALSGWLKSDSNISNNKNISYEWENYTTGQSATNTTSDYAIDALTTQSQYGLKVSIPSITQTIYTNNGSVTKTFSAISNILTFKVYDTTISISPKITSDLTANDDGTYNLTIGSNANIALTSNDASNAYWQSMSAVSWNWYDLTGQLGTNNPLTTVNGNSISSISYDTNSLSLPGEVNYTTRTYYLVMAYTKNGKEYTITSNEITLVVNAQLPLSTTINGQNTNINSGQNIQLIFGDQQTISFQYNQDLGVSQTNFNPQIYVDGVNVTQTKANANSTVTINGNSYPTIPINVSNDTYTFKTYPTPVNQILSYQVVINDNSSTPNPCYPLKSVTFNIAPITSKVSIVTYLPVTGSNAGVTTNAYPYAYPISLKVANNTNNPNLNLPSNPTYQWYKFVNGVATAIPNIPTTSDWPQAWNGNNQPNFSFTPSALNNESSYNFYVMNGMTGVYELGIVNNGVTLFSNQVEINLLNSTDYIPTICNNSLIAGKNGSQYVSGYNDATSTSTINISNQPAGSYVNIRLTNLDDVTGQWAYYSKYLDITTQSSTNNQTFTQMTNNVVIAGQTVYYRWQYSCPQIQQVNPFDSNHQVVTFVPQYSNTVSVKGQSVDNSVEVSNSQATPISQYSSNGEFMPVTPGAAFYWVFPTYYDNLGDPGGWWGDLLSNLDNSYYSDNSDKYYYYTTANGVYSHWAQIVTLQQLVEGNWTVIGFVDLNTYNSSASTPYFSTFKYDSLWASSKNNSLFAKGNYVFKGVVINSLTSVKYRLQAFSANTLTSSSNPTFVLVDTSDVLTVTPAIPTGDTNIYLLYSSYTAYYDEKTNKFGYTNTLGGYTTSTLYTGDTFNITEGTGAIGYGVDPTIVPWIAEVGGGIPFAISVSPPESSIDGNPWVTTGFEVKNSQGKILTSSDFDFNLSPFTQAQTGATCQGELDAQNSNITNNWIDSILDGTDTSFLTSTYCLTSTNTNDWTGSLQFIATMTVGNYTFTATPITLSFPTLQANKNYWSIQQNSNVKSVGNNTYDVNANTPINWNCMLPNEQESMSYSLSATSGFPLLSSALDTTGFYTFDVQYYDPQTQEWISYFDPWTANASFLTIGSTPVTVNIQNNKTEVNNFTNWQSGVDLANNGGTVPSSVTSQYSVLNTPSYYLYNSTSNFNNSGNWSVSSQNLLDNLAYNNWTGWDNISIVNTIYAISPSTNGSTVSQLSGTNGAPYQSLTFPSLSTWSVNPFSWNIAKSGKYRIAMVFSLYNYVTPTASQIKNLNLEVYSPTYTFNVNQTTNIQLSANNNSNILSSTNKNGFSFYNLNSNGTYTLSYDSSVIDWNGDKEYNEATVASQYTAPTSGTTISFKPDTVSSNEYAMLWAGPVVILQYQWIYYPLSGGSSQVISQPWINSISGYDPSATTNSAMFNDLYNDASSGQILGLASGSTTQYQPGTGLNPQSVLDNASLTLSGSNLKPGYYELSMDVLYTSFVGIMVNSFNVNATTNPVYNWNIFGDNANDVYTTVTSNPIVILSTSNN